MKYEEGMQRLTEIVAKLEEGGLPLEDAVTLYSEGAALAAECEKELNHARLKIEGIGNASDTSTEES
ncbi:MAG: exodeoxyribonuclease VII small subunit [Oscillospiraceae bacterium]|jgi:exodeoxyribonuclease VII small subunit|nr:exodeoxyribonuclease VII small subunit [Oscillospiraceae bacterium]